MNLKPYLCLFDAAHVHRQLSYARQTLGHCQESELKATRFERSVPTIEMFQVPAYCASILGSIAEVLTRLGQTIVTPILL